MANKKKRSRGKASKQTQKPAAKPAQSNKSFRLATGLSGNPMKMGQPVGNLPRQMKGARGTGLSKCAEIYAKALINPWGEFDEMPCVPCTPSELTYKFRNVTRGSFSTGTAGIGFASWAPFNPANNIASVYTSGATFAGTGFATTGTGVTGSNRSNLPYPNAAFVGSAAGFTEGRLVGSVMRVKNTTAPLYRQGSILAARGPFGSSLASFTPAQLQTELDNVKDAADGNEWTNWPWVPEDQNDYDFPDTSIDYSSSVRGYGSYGILVQGASTSNPSTFDFEILEFWEFISSNPLYPMPSLTKTHSDVVGLGRVLEAVAVPVQSLRVEDQAQHVAQNVVDAMAHSDSAAKTVEDLLGIAGLAIPAIKTVVGSLTSMLLL